MDSVYAPNAYWLLVAYAKAKGAAAGPWLDRLRGAPKVVFLLRDVDAAKAVSLGVTSFVSAGRASGRHFPCRDLEPRDTLDRLVLGVLQGDVRDTAQTGGAAAGIGFRFLTAEPWAKPPETLTEAATTVMTEFVDGDGHVSGAHPISFLAQPEAGRPVQMDARGVDGVVQAMAGYVGRR